MKVDHHLVSVVIPAYNACSTIDETLRSVRTQSHENLEIIVVDDGSIDTTSAIAQEHASHDPRVKIITQKNAGVAAARNTGWKSARSDFIAFIDADDLWAATNIERQLQVMLAAGGKTGLVYSWSAIIDAGSRVFNEVPPTLIEGDVLDNIFQGNFIGNGSAVLVRREALVAAKGFESELHAKGAQGCEDLLFYCRVAESFHFAVVPEYLVGYRNLPQNMSSNMPRMIRSWMLVMDEMLSRYPDREEKLTRGLTAYSGYLLVRALGIGKFDYIISLLVLLAQRDPLLVAKVFANDFPRDLAKAARRRLLRLRFPLSRRPLLPFPIGASS
ncbi:glycosyltransferase family 2 protein [Bradyrhizobium vignae]|uniref:Glycosyltransferase family 2 protein n=1 Tax=Bradyrhizobium vignae TaxID=1549949 RepID=A0ABS4A0G1_9BRAD|nr:glycosyltransferase family 2 protein [Bradyrhizobium vignae]MBP0113882.1 glycosyltransferase family 2 protein [Bradyrhizobium vignae]